MASLKRAFSIYSRNPFNFVWSSLLYVFLFLVSLFAAIGLFMIYFIISSVFKQPVKTDSIPTMAVVAVIGILFYFTINGLNASLARAYRSAMANSKTSLIMFYSYALGAAPSAFVVLLVRDLVTLLLVGPAVAAYFLVLKQYQYLDILVGGYALVMVFTIHLAFTPALLSVGALGASLYSSFKQAFYLLKQRHIFFIGLYIIFAVTWLLNFIPFLQLATIFFLYPVVYAAMIQMMETSPRKGVSRAKGVRSRDQEEE